MEVQQHQGLEMAEVTSKLYDIIHPSPVSLKQLSAIAISLELWRLKVNEYRTSRKMDTFYPWSRHENTWIKKMLPDLPSTIYKTIEKVVSRFGKSLFSWMEDNDRKGFYSEYSHENYVLNDFDDFVCDYDGSIHYLRTAERMMRCTKFTPNMKFTIACLYFFEDDIRQIWPSVSDYMYLDEYGLRVDYIVFHECPQLYYWIARLTNELSRIPTGRDKTVDERMLGASVAYNRPSVEYFWNRIPLEKRMQACADVEFYNLVRFILPKLDDEQLDEFVNDWYADDLYTIFLNLYYDEWIVLRIWLHISKITNRRNFRKCIIRMFEIEYNGDDDNFDPEEWQYLCCQIWNHAPLNLKRSVIRVISSNSNWFDDIDIKWYYDYPNDNKINVDLLLTILQDASLKERNSFWRNCWSGLIEPVRGKDYLQRVIELCFGNEDEINQFKLNVMVKSEDVFEFCARLLEHACFEELNAFVSFCSPELQTAKNLKQQILQSVFFDEDYEFSPYIVCSFGELNEFVNDAFDNVDASIDFKNLLMSSSSVVKRLASIICSDEVTSKNFIEFIDTFVSTEEALKQIKMSLIDSLKEYVTTNNAYVRGDIFGKDEFNSILLWCLGSNERVEEFKLNCT
ncbi:uncharacterized protein LOC135847739 isoform X1 [Planococcus citri]|uniref:uncharacterized protein LOC135847739 isoform X1 n=1 Tax=Planococcus citri TaxID=170843 RepID=UPI0031F98366